MLITDKQTTMKLSERLTEFSKFGMAFNFLLENNKIDINEVEDIFFSKDDEKSTFRYINMMRKLDPKDMDEAYDKYCSLVSSEGLSRDEHIEKLNLLCTSKIINMIASKNESSIDKTYVNTYNFLMEQNQTDAFSYSYGK